jgi:hypothetical protein
VIEILRAHERLIIEETGGLNPSKAISKEHRKVQIEQFK